jgi:hypothetical protein
MGYGCMRMEATLMAARRRARVEFGDVFVGIG